MGFQSSPKPARLGLFLDERLPLCPALLRALSPCRQEGSTTTLPVPGVCAATRCSRKARRCTSQVGTPLCWQGMFPGPGEVARDPIPSTPSASCPGYAKSSTAGVRLSPSMATGLVSEQLVPALSHLKVWLPCRVWFLSITCACPSSQITDCHMGGEGAVVHSESQGGGPRKTPIVGSRDSMLRCPPGAQPPPEAVPAVCRTCTPRAPMQLVHQCISCSVQLGEAQTRPPGGQQALGQCWRWQGLGHAGTRQENLSLGVQAVHGAQTLSLCTSGSEVWHPICKQAARAEKKLKVGGKVRGLSQRWHIPGNATLESWFLLQ